MRYTTGLLQPVNFISTPQPCCHKAAIHVTGREAADMLKHSQVSPNLFKSKLNHTENDGRGKVRAQVSSSGHLPGFGSRAHGNAAMTSC